MKKGSLRSYLIYVALCLITFLLLFLFVNNINKNDAQRENVLDGFIPQIGKKDIVLNLKSYAVDNSAFILYILDTENEIFDKEFKTYLMNNNVSYQIVYVDSNNLTKKAIIQLKEEFFDNNLGSISEEIFLQANLFFISNGKVKNILYKDRKSINIVDVDNYFKRIGDITND